MPTTMTSDMAERYGSDIDVFAPEVLLDPYAAYRALHDIGPLVYLQKYQTWMAAWYDAVRRILVEHDTFSSAQGIGFNDRQNQAWSGMLPTLDRPEHTALRRVYDEVLSPRAISGLQHRMEASAERFVDDMLDRREFDGAQVAEHFPVAMMADLVGFPNDSRRDHLVHSATDSYNCCGPEGSFEKSWGNLNGLYAYVAEISNRKSIPEGTFAAHALDAVERKEITQSQCIGIIGGYATASLDTTANGTGLMLMLLAQHPEQWDIVREKPDLVENAVREGLRLETPAQWFTRVTTQDVEFDDIQIPVGTRLMHSYGAANRDPRKWDDPDKFDVQRATVGTMTWGFGIHSCPGKFISNLDVRSLLTAMTRRVRRLELTGVPEIRLNNLTRGMAKLPLRVVPV